jgi:hypothetical protein
MVVQVPPALTACAVRSARFTNKKTNFRFLYKHVHFFSGDCGILGKALHLLFNTWDCNFVHSKGTPGGTHFLPINTANMNLPIPGSKLLEIFSLRTCQIDSRHPLVSLNTNRKDEFSLVMKA